MHSSTRNCWGVSWARRAASRIGLRALATMEGKRYPRSAHRQWRHSYRPAAADLEIKPAAPNCWARRMMRGSSLDEMMITGTCAYSPRRCSRDEKPRAGHGQVQQHQLDFRILLHRCAQGLGAGRLHNAKRWKAVVQHLDQRCAKQRVIVGNEKSGLGHGPESATAGTLHLHKRISRSARACPSPRLRPTESGSQSSLMLLAVITRPHLLRSLLTNFSICSELPGMGSTPMAARRALVRVSASANCSDWLNFLTTSAELPLGTTMPRQA